MNLPLFDQAEPTQPEPSRPSTLTVAELSQSLKLTLEETFGYVTVIGEVVECNAHSSGHIYLSLKDQKTQDKLKAIAWRSSAAKMRPFLQNGNLVQASGRITTYGAQSTYQLTLNSVQPAGQGALLQLLAERKEKLAAEGLFDEEHKQPLPFLPQHIGLITSPTGAVIRDMLHRIAARSPRKVTLWPAPVQGEGASAKLTAAINGFQNLPKAQQPDVLILARGGGSMEDLMPFNEEDITRAVAACTIPIISAVGHEPDISLTDFAADWRAPTPTAAAERVVPVREDLLYTVENLEKQNLRILERRLETANQLLDNATMRLPNPLTLVETYRQQLTVLEEKLTNGTNMKLEQWKINLSHTEKLLTSLAPEAIQKRGFIYATGEDGTLLTSAKTPQKTATLHFADGTRKAQLTPQNA